MSSQNIPDNTINVLDHGFVRLVRYLGNDDFICDFARNSYGKGTKTKRDNEQLIQYLIEHEHTSPLESVEYVFHIKMPIFVARQWVRHRTHSMNEYSLRYSKAIEEFYVPDLNRFKTQSSKNKQMSSDIGLPADVSEEAAKLIRFQGDACFSTYRTLINMGIARETARLVLPLNTYTMFYWKQNLHNLMHLLKLRTASDAQWEIQQYAKAICLFVKETCPIAYEAYSAKYFNKEVDTHE